MKRISGLLALILVLSAGLALAGENTGRVTQVIKPAVGPEATSVKLWVPYPLSSETQTISDVTLKGNYSRQGIYRDAKTDAVYVQAEWDEVHGQPVLELAFRATSTEVRVQDLRDSGQPVPETVRPYLASSQWLPTDGRIGEIAAEITRGRKTILEKARAVYDWTVANTYRDPDVAGCGVGIVEQTLARRGGKCADISSVFVALARAAGVPARDVFGLRLGTKAEEDITGGYHCWAEFYLPGTGWVPADPADVRKAMLVNKLELGQAGQHIEYFWGGVDENRIVLEREARGVTLQGSQAGELNYFMYPHLEIDGKPLDCLQPKTFSYTVGYRKG